MSKVYLTLGFGLISVGMALPAFAGVTFGDPKSDTGALTISGALRGNYQDKDYGESASDQKIKFDAAILRLGYESPDWFGKVEYRCYQYDKFCDFSTLVYGYAGYHLNSTDHITVGVQPIPFGPGRFGIAAFMLVLTTLWGYRMLRI